jgi:hypothetical protein
MEVSPEKATTETERGLGIIEKGHRNGLEFVHGKSGRKNECIILVFAFRYFLMSLNMAALYCINKDLE